MTYAPPYAAPAQTTDPTNVMGRRIGAYFIDVLLPTVVAVIVFFSVWLNNASKLTGQPTNYCTDISHPGHACFQTGNTVYLPTNTQTGHAVLIAVAIWLLAPLNAIVLQGLTGATVGKFMFGLRVVRGDGQIAGFGWVLLRSFLFVVDNMCAALVGLITALVTHPHRRVGDMAAGTYVVSKDWVGRPVVPQPGYAAGAYPYSPSGMYAPPPTAQSWPPPQAQPSGQSIGQPSGQPPLVTQPQPTGQSADNPTAPGWGAPADQWRPAQQPPQPTPGYAPPPVVQDPTEPHWDPARNAWIAWEPTRGQWMQFDATNNEWRAM